MRIKVYSWKTLLGTVCIAGGMLVYKIISFSDVFDLWWIGLFGYLLFQGLKISLTKSGHEAEQERIKEAKKLFQKMLDKYGKITYFLQYGPLGFLALAILIALIIPDEDWAAITGLVFLGLFVVLIITNKIFEKKVKAE